MGGKTKIQYPRQTIIVSSRHNNKDNAMTLSWHSPASFDPELYSIYLSKKRLSHELIGQSRQFCVNFISKDDRESALLAGRNSGKDMEKFETLEKEECEKIDCPRLKNAMAIMECEVIDEFEVGDHIIFIGKVVNKKELKEGKRLFHLGGDNFTTTED